MALASLRTMPLLRARRNTRGLLVLVLPDGTELVHKHLWGIRRQMVELGWGHTTAVEE